MKNWNRARRATRRGESTVRPAIALPTPGNRIDAAWLLTAYVLVLMLIPANLTIAALGAIGTPALIVGLGALIWWIGAQMNRASATLTPAQPVRRAALGFALAVLASYVVAMVRPIDGLEINAADRGLLLIASWIGLIVLSCDGLTTRARLELPLRAFVTVGGIVALIGILQFITGRALVDVIQIPGLTPNTDLTSIYDRGGFTRAAGTSTHPIEFGVVLAMILPLALHFAFSDTHRGRIQRWFPVAVIAFAVPITISRSALVGVVVALLVLMPTWTARRRRLSYLVIGAIVVVVYVAIPGMLGTLIRLFTGLAADGSARSRTDSYALAGEFIARSPFFGRGLSTFLPEYRILDNQYLGLLIEVGIVGTLAILVLFVVAIGTAFRTRRMSSDPTTRSLAQSLTALVAVGACTFATFDAFGFPQASSLVFLGIGFIGALSNIVKRGSDRSADPIKSRADAAPRQSI
ncbi:MAG: O-antigen ligase family protein [Leifsonia sp.]